MSRRLALLSLALAMTLSSLAAAAASRPYQGDGACLSCHQRDLAALPSQPCMGCHFGNMGFLDDHGATSMWPEASALAAVGGGGLLLCLGVIGLLLVRKQALPAACMMVVIAAGAVQGTASPDAAPWPGAFKAAQGSACDLFARFSPDGSAFLFSSRGPDTNEDGSVDMRDGQALFLWRRGWQAPRRISSYCLDFAASMAAWSPDGRTFALPCPIADTDGDGRVGMGDRHALLLFDASGRRIAATAVEGLDCLSPQFSWDGRQVAFVAGRTLYAWDCESEGLAVLYEAPEDRFPRMGGWPRSMAGPVYWEGRDYARLPRDGERRFVFPEDSPVVSAGTGLRAESGPARRIKAISGRDAVFYMAQPEGGTFGLRRWDGRSEERVSPPGRLVHIFDLSRDGRCWFWSSERPGGPARLESWGAREEALRIELDAAPSLLGLAARDDGGALVCFRRGGRPSRTLAVVDAKGILWASGGGGAWFRPSAGGRAVAAVYVPEDTDDDGDLTPLDQGELWVSWEGP